MPSPAMLPFDLLNVHPRRHALLRTRAPMDAVMDAIRVYVDEAATATAPPPHGSVEGGQVTENGFLLDYHASERSGGHYTVRGSVRDAGDWRELEVRVTADMPWIGVGGFTYLIAYGALSIYTRGEPMAVAMGLTGLVIVVLAFFQIFWWPVIVADDVAYRLARDLHGSVLEKGRWFVPRAG